MSSPIATALMCHAPIVVPDVAGARAPQCVKSTAAMRQAAQQLLAHAPDVVVVLSPHTPRRAGFCVIDGDAIRGSFDAFGAADCAVDFSASTSLRARLIDRGVDHAPLHKLDHGALVPLFFLAEAGYAGAVVVVALPRAPTTTSCRAFGNLLRDAIDAGAGGAGAGERVAIVASGDCSHRLIPGAPAGFHPMAQQFDDKLRAAIANSDDITGIGVDDGLRDLAAEDVVDTVLVAETAARTKVGRAVLSYEGPFGVGYLVAVLSADNDGAAVLVDVAKDALAAHLARRSRRQFDTTTVDRLDVTGAFVTWRDRGELRGCVGRMSLDKPLSEAVAELAVSSASADPRFVPVRDDEAGGLDAEITLLEKPQAVASVEELNPAVWGVEAKHGWRHGVLLPGIDGVESVEQQLSIVLQKAGIRKDEPYTLRKFRARKVC